MIDSCIPITQIGFCLLRSSKSFQFSWDQNVWVLPSLHFAVEFNFQSDNKPYPQWHNRPISQSPSSPHSKRHGSPNTQRYNRRDSKIQTPVLPGQSLQLSTTNRLRPRLLLVRVGGPNVTAASTYTVIPLRILSPRICRSSPTPGYTNYPGETSWDHFAAHTVCIVHQQSSFTVHVLLFEHYFSGCVETRWKSSCPANWWYPPNWWSSVRQIKWNGCLIRSLDQTLRRPEFGARYCGSLPNTTSFVDSNGLYLDLVGSSGPDLHNFLVS